MSKPKVVVVNQNLNAIEKLVVGLRDLCTVEPAINLAKVMMILKKAQIDLILYDISTMNDNLISITHQIQKSIKNVPVLFVTKKQDDSLSEVEDISLVVTPLENKEFEVQVSDYIQRQLLKKQLLATQELIEKQQEVALYQTKMDSLSRMVQNISHQWRQPLSVISTAAVNMKLQQQLGLLTPKEIEASCNLINYYSQYLSGIITNFHKQSYVHLEELDITTQLELFTQSLPDDISLDLNMKEGLVIQGSADIFQEILQKLLKNSIDASSSEQKLIFITIYSDKEKVYLDFLDNSGGIKDDIIEYIFEPYFTTKHQSQEVGLGLYKVYRDIQDVFSGKIGVHNNRFVYKQNSYKGAKFQLQFQKVTHEFS